jgi:hypothetical protein
VIIEKIEWLSKEAREAEVIITHGTYSCLAFSCPCKYEIGENIYQPLHGIFCENIYRALENKMLIQKVGNGYFRHIGVGEIISHVRKLIRIGGLFIILEILPKDLRDGEYVEFICGRLDLR